MTALDFLKDLEIFLNNEVLQEVKLLSDNGSGYVHPYSAIMHLPNSNFTPQGFNVPYMAIELDNANDDAEEHTLDVRITFGVYGGCYYKSETGEKTDIPDAFGYIDLLNIIDRSRIAILSRYTLDGGVIRKPITYGTYDVDVPYPYWYGYIKFTAEIPASEFTVRKEIDF